MTTIMNMCDIFYEDINEEYAKGKYGEFNIIIKR